jgi:MFS family permease
MRFLLGMAESGVFPAASVLMANWFPRSERARAVAYWLTCQPLAVAATSPITSGLLGRYDWQWTLIVEGILPLLWLPVWWFGVRDEPREAKWVSAEERDFLERTISAEKAHLEPVVKVPLFKRLGEPAILTLVTLYFLHNSALFGCMTFFTAGLKARGFNALEYGILFSIPYTLAVIAMVVNSRHSDKVHERRAHIGLPYLASGILLILSVVFSAHFWVSYVLLCLAIPGPFAAMPVFWAVPAEYFPRGMMGQAIGLVNALGNLGGLAGPYFVGWLTDKYHSTGVPFVLLGVGTIFCARLAFMLPKSARMEEILVEQMVDVPMTGPEVS